ncbi:MAG: DUF5683 domain-containing protein [Candidatus Kryptoniota bacterium]
MNTRVAFFLTLFLTSNLLAQYRNTHNLTGVLSNDLFSENLVSKPDNFSTNDSTAVIETRAALKSGLFSLIIPGAGQAYNGNYLKAGIFFAVEVAGWVVNVVWNKKGDNQTNFFQQYADGTSSRNYSDGHWSALQYAQWIKQDLNLIMNVNGTTGANAQIAQEYVQKMIVNKGVPEPWSDVDWYALNQVESAIGGYFSHLLPPHGQQQYYELIGKYPQFRQGWDDSEWGKAVRHLAGGDSLFVDYVHGSTPHSSYYMDQRGLANDYYAIASTAVGVVIVNHFISAIEAALYAHAKEKKIRAQMSMKALPLNAGYMTELGFSYQF